MRTGGYAVAKDYRISLLLDFYGPMLTQTQREMFEFYYNDDLSLSEIAENEGITRQGVRDSVKRAENQLLEMEERLGLAHRFREMMDGLEQIKTTAMYIKEYNEHSVYAREINDSAEKILSITRKICE